MTEGTSWEYYKYKRYLGILCRKYLHFEFGSYAGKKLLSPEKGNTAIKNLIENGKPFVAARFGATELSVLVEREAKRIGKSSENRDQNLCTLSGFFPEDKRYVDRFVQMMMDEISQIDLLGIWYNPGEEYIVNRYMEHTMVTNIEAMEPYIYETPWSKALKGKKVLIIHPFAESIERQYLNHKQLFQNPDILPDFEIKTIRAVQTLAGEKDARFETWFDALDYMKEAMDTVDYDIAVIGCGAYGMPLAIHAKKMQKQAVHMGGATQILFGIKGNRWDNNPVISGLYNEYWVRPAQSETIKRQDAVENGCYW